MFDEERDCVPCGRGPSPGTTRLAARRILVPRPESPPGSADEQRAGGDQGRTDDGRRHVGRRPDIDRPDLATKRAGGSAGDVSPPGLLGPCIVEEYDATCVIPPGAKASLDGRGNIVIELGQEI